MLKEMHSIYVLEGIEEKLKKEMISELVSIDLRPKRGIHWEGDLFVSPSKLNHSVSGAMFVEQKSQYMQSFKMENRKTSTMVRVVNNFLKNWPYKDFW